MISKISFANVMTTPPARVRKPLARWDGSWLLSDMPTCTTPKPSRMSPTLLMSPKMNVERSVSYTHLTLPTIA